MKIVITSFDFVEAAGEVSDQVTLLFDSRRETNDKKNMLVNHSGYHDMIAGLVSGKFGECSMIKIERVED